MHGFPHVKAARKGCKRIYFAAFAMNILHRGGGCPSIQQIDGDFHQFGIITGKAVVEEFQFCIHKDHPGRGGMEGGDDGPAQIPSSPGYNDCLVLKCQNLSPMDASCA